MQREELVRRLNEDLQLELRSVVQYVHHISTIKGPEYQQTLVELSKHVHQELDHALALAAQIDFLGGEPSTRVPEVEPQDEPNLALTQDLALEEAQLDRYRDRVDEARKLDLPDVALALAPLLKQTQDHVMELRTALGR